MPAQIRGRDPPAHCLTQDQEKPARTWPFSTFVWPLSNTRQEDLLDQVHKHPEDKQNEGAGLGLSKQMSFKIYLPQTELLDLVPLTTPVLVQMWEQTISSH